MAAGTIGKYERLDVLGHGTSGVVYLAWDTLLRRQVALKEIRADGAETERLLEEARVLDRLRHPHIVRIHSVDVAPGGVILLDMELVRGQNLASLLKERGGTPLPAGETARIVCDILSALGYAHEQRIVHRDIKPANVLIASDGAVKLTDFGLAEALGTGSLAGGGGTYPYMAPEDFAEDAASDRSSDLWAAGVLLYELLTARRPFSVARIKDPFAWKRTIETDTPPPPSTINPALAPEWDAVLSRALSKEKGARYPSAAAFAAAVGAVAGVVPSATPVAVPAAPPTDARVYPPGTGAVPPVAVPPVTNTHVPSAPSATSFVFASTGEIVYTLDDLLRLSARNWDESRRTLTDGRMEIFLRAKGEVYVADMANDLRRRARRGESPDALLQEFLERAQGEEEGTVVAGGREPSGFPFAPQTVPAAATPPTPAPNQAPASNQLPALRWWYWPVLALCLAPAGAALLAGAQNGHDISLQTLMGAWAVIGGLCAMLLLVATGARMTSALRWIAVLPLGLGVLSEGGIVAQMAQVGGMPAGLIIPAAFLAFLLTVQALTARIWWRFWLTLTIAFAALAVGLFAAIH